MARSTVTILMPMAAIHRTFSNDGEFIIPMRAVGVTIDAVNDKGLREVGRKTQRFIQSALAQFDIYKAETMHKGGK
jgi:hypothetical protein